MTHDPRCPRLANNAAGRNPTARVKARRPPRRSPRPTRLVLVLSLACLWACPEEDQEPTSIPIFDHPEANAGADQNVDVGTMVTLDGSTSSGGSGTLVSYTWSIATLPSGSSAVLMTDLASPQATVVVDEPGWYEFRLIVSTSSVSSPPDHVSVYTLDPVITNATPNTGAVGDLVTITGKNFSSSIDRNEVTFNGVVSTATTASATQLQTMVPLGATTGPIAVKTLARNQTGIGPTFTVTSPPPADPWETVHVDLIAGYDELSFANAMVGMATALPGQVLITADGGLTWTSGTSVDVASYGQISDVSLPHPDTAYVIAGHATVLRSGDGGASWTVVRPAGTQALNALAFATGSEGWVVGDDGVILHTDDAGKNWDTQTSGTSDVLIGVFFVGGHFGVAIGSTGDVTRTNDGGATDWSAATLPDVGFLQDVWFADQNNGMIIGRSTTATPLVFRTTDGGATWPAVMHDLPATVSVYAISLATPDIATLTGENGASARAIFRSENGGVNWTLEQFTSPRRQVDVVMLDASVGVSTGFGIIMRRH